MLDFLLVITMQGTLEEQGALNNLYSFSIDHWLLENINSEHGTQYTFEELTESGKRCLANRWIAYDRMSGRDLENILLTNLGASIAKSKRASLQAEAEKPKLKQLSEKMDNSGIPYWINVGWGVGGALLGFFGSHIGFIEKYFNSLVGVCGG